MVLHHWVWYNFMGSSLVFQFLHIYVLNYCYFQSDCLTFFLNKKRWKNKKTLKKAFFYRKIKNVYKRLLQLWSPAYISVLLDSSRTEAIRFMQFIIVAALNRKLSVYLSVVGCNNQTGDRICI